MKKTVFTGAATALVTPFDKSGINFEVLEELIEFQINGGIDCILICGTTGEASTMPDSEHKEAIKFAVDKVNGRLPVIAGTGSNHTAHAIELSKYAQQAGADAILTVTPYYNKTTQEGLYEHFKAIAGSVDIPVILYNVPTRTVLNIDPDTLSKLAGIDNIVGIKECNLGQVGETAKLCGEDFAIYSGDDFQVLPMLAFGGKGVISVVANLIPGDMHQLVARFLDGDIKGSRELQLKILDLTKALFSVVNPIALKKAMRIKGFNVGNLRLPLTELDEENTKKLKAAMKEYGMI